MDKLYDTTPFAYVGNNKYYEDNNGVKTTELPTSDEVQENSASVIGQMLPQVGLSTNEQPSVDNVITDGDNDKLLKDDNKPIINIIHKKPNGDFMVPVTAGGYAVYNYNNNNYIGHISADNDAEAIKNFESNIFEESLKEYLDDEINGTELYFENVNIIQKIKEKINKANITDRLSIDNRKILNAAKAYTASKLASARMKILIVDNTNNKNTFKYKELNKKAINEEKSYRKIKKDLNNDEIKILNSYIKEFDMSYNKKINSQIKDMKIDVQKTLDSLVKTESTSNIQDATDIYLEKSIESDMKPIVEKLNKKGYETLASSSGHKNVIRKTDTNKDNVDDKDDHYYGDARLIFKGHYNLGKAPKYWYWKKVENFEEVMYLDIIQISEDKIDGDQSKFENWKENYMKSLSEWVDSLPDNKNSDNELEIKESEIDLDETINTLTESTFNDLLFDIE